MKNIKLLTIILITIPLFLLTSCTNSSENSNELKELTFDYRQYKQFSSFIKSNNLESYSSFEDFKTKLLNVQKPIYNYTENDFIISENILTEVGVFDNNVSEISILTNATNLLVINNYISNNTKTFLDFELSKSTINIDELKLNVQNFINFGNITNTEIDFLNSYLDFLDNDDKLLSELGCRVLGSSVGFLCGAIGTAISGGNVFAGYCCAVFCGQLTTELCNAS